MAAGTMAPAHALLSWVDWGVIALMFTGVTVAGHVLVGRRVTGARGFFLGDRSMPWWSVTASMIATKVSALTFIALPAAVFVAGGNLTYVQATFGFILGNILMALVFARPFYDAEVYSPYDYMGRRLDLRVAVLAKVLFLIAAVLSQSVRLVATGIVLQVITGWPIVVSIGAIIALSIIWSSAGGIKTVIWTDAIMFVIFTLGGILAAIWAFYGAHMPLPEAIHWLNAHSKLALIDLSTDPRKVYTLWAGLIGAAMFEMGSNTIDQTVTQRVMTCRSARDAQKACIGAALGVVPSYIMLLTGLGLALFYHKNPLPPAMAQFHQPGHGDAVFPYFVATQVPTGLAGLIIAALFASGISTLNSALTAIAQTTVNGLGVMGGVADDNADNDRGLVRRSRLFIVGWGVVLGLISMGCLAIQADSGKNLLDLGLEAPAYVYGSLLGVALLARMGRGNWNAIVVATVISTAAVILMKIQDIGFFWYYPVAAAIVVVIAGGFKIAPRPAEHSRSPRSLSEDSRPIEAVTEPS